MRKIELLFCAIAAFCVVSCVQTNSNSNESKESAEDTTEDVTEVSVESTEKVAGSEKKATVKSEDFSTFIAKFLSSDAAYQASRVIFPVEQQKMDWGAGKKIPYTAANWDKIDGCYTEKIDAATYSGVWHTDGGMCSYNVIFELKGDGKWYLVKYISASVDCE